jgi:hypothetical protein
VPKEITFKDMIEDIYKKPYDQIPKEEIKRQAREVFCFGFSKEDLSDDGSDLETLKDIMSN